MSLQVGTVYKNRNLEVSGPRIKPGTSLKWRIYNRTISEVKWIPRTSQSLSYFNTCFSPSHGKTVANYRVKYHKQILVHNVLSSCRVFTYAFLSCCKYHRTSTNELAFVHLINKWNEGEKKGGGTSNTVVLFIVDPSSKWSPTQDCLLKSLFFKYRLPRIKN